MRDSCCERSAILVTTAQPKLGRERLHGAALVLAVSLGACNMIFPYGADRVRAAEQGGATTDGRPGGEDPGVAPDGTTLDDGASSDAARPDGGRPDATADVTDATAGEQPVQDQGPVTDAEAAVCSDWAAWSCVTGPNGCEVACPPFFVRCVDNLGWQCQCYVKSVLVLLFAASSSMSCSSCRRNVPACFGGLAP